MLELKIPAELEKNKDTNIEGTTPSVSLVETKVNKENATTSKTKKLDARTVNELSTTEYEEMQIRINIATQTALLKLKAQEDLALSNRYKEQQMLVEEGKNSVGKNVGVASVSFALQMEKEIEEGRFIDFLYSKHIAAVKGGLRVLQISGYKIVFVENLKTKIPTLLYEQAMLFIEGVPSNSELTKFTGDGTLTQEERDFISKSSNGYLKV